MKIRKDSLRFILGLTALLAITFLAGLFPSSNPSDIETAKTSFVSTDQMQGHDVLIVIVAGHGDVIDKEYQTCGKQSPEWWDGLKVYEGFSTHMAAEELVLKLREVGIDRINVTNKPWDYSLSDRVRMCNGIWSIDKRAICIFLHHNAQPYNVTADYWNENENQYGWSSPATGGATGIEVFTSRGQTRSDEFADCVIKKLDIAFPDSIMPMRLDLTDGDLDKEANFYVLKNTYGKAILIEFGFMTTYTDCKIITDPVWREIYLDAIVDGILEYEAL